MPIPSLKEETVIQQAPKGPFGQPFRTAILQKYWQGGQVATERYKARLSQWVHAGMCLLHAGCGWDKNHVSSPYKEMCEVTGIDLDPRVETMFHSRFFLASLSQLPFEDNSFDIIFSEYVFEHVADPAAAFREMARVLKPGGRVLILTPNLWSYKSLVAFLTPQAFHLWMGRMRYGRGHEADMYPTCYRCNTVSQFHRFARQNSLKITGIQHETNGPTWFIKFPVLFELFHLFHLVIRRFDLFRSLRCALIVEMEKP